MPYFQGPSLFCDGCGRAILVGAHVAVVKTQVLSGLVTYLGRPDLDDLPTDTEADDDEEPMVRYFHGDCLPQPTPPPLEVTGA